MAQVNLYGVNQSTGAASASMLSVTSGTVVRFYVQQCGDSCPPGGCGYGVRVQAQPPGQAWQDYSTSQYLTPDSDPMKAQGFAVFFDWGTSGLHTGDWYVKVFAHNNPSPCNVNLWSSAYKLTVSKPPASLSLTVSPTSVSRGAGGTVHFATRLSGGTCYAHDLWWQPPGAAFAKWGTPSGQYCASGDTTAFDWPASNLTQVGTYNFKTYFGGDANIGPGFSNAVSVAVTEASIGTAILLGTDRTTYAPGETVCVQGTLYRTDTGTGLSGHPVSVWASWGGSKSATTGSTLECGTGPPAPGGFHVQFPGPASGGTYTVSASFGGAQVAALAAVDVAPAPAAGALAALGLAAWFILGRHRAKPSKRARG